MTFLAGSMVLGTGPDGLVGALATVALAGLCGAETWVGAWTGAERTGAV